VQFNENISRDDLNALPLQAFKKEIHVIDSLDKVEEAAEYLKKQKMLGFDTETKPSFQKGQKNKVALLQLSTEEHAFLIRICKIGLPKPIADILADENILKMGVAIRDDIKGLQKWQFFEPAGFIELSNFAKEFGIQASGLKKLCGIVMGFRISKSKQLSNWEEEHLEPGQKTYGATDAWAGLMIYKKLKNIEEN